MVEGCIFGEAINDKGICYSCPPEKYTIKINSENCNDCIENTICPGSFVINVNPGYWRPHNLSDLVEHCLYAESNCLGGTGNFTCFEGKHYIFLYDLFLNFFQFREKII